jgi:hypothetical protein
MPIAATREPRKASGSDIQDTGIYLYCFARADAVQDIRSAGIDDTRRVSGLRVNDIAAVFSLVSLGEFVGAAARSHLEDPAWVLPRACQHEWVIEEVMGRSPVLPVRFGSMFTSTRLLRDLLDRKSWEISLFLDLLSDKEEWSVKCFADLDKSREWLLRSDPEFGQKRERAPSSPGARYFHERHLHLQADKKARQDWPATAKQVENELKDHAHKTCPLRLQPRNVSGRREEMISNCAFLLLRENLMDFQAHVESFGADYRERGITVELSGPWPPYSFCPSLVETSG